MQKKWLFVITPKTKLIDLNLKEVWQYRDLLMLFGFISKSNAYS
jgi:lipopolysaccharide transport system permease protein